MNPEVFSKNWMSCSHCQCSTVLIGSKLITDFLNVGPDISPDANAKPTIFEALILIFGFQLPQPEVVMNTASGIQYFNYKGESYRHLSICVNCESVLTNLYKVFLLFTELSNGKESFILKNSIISGRLVKEEEVIPLDNSTSHNNYHSHTAVAVRTSFPHPQPVLVSNQKLSTTIRRELTSEVIAEMLIPNTISVSITPATTDVQKHGDRNTVSILSRMKKNLTPTHGTASLGTKSKEGLHSSGSDAKVVEVITLDDEDEVAPSCSITTTKNNEKHRSVLPIHSSPATSVTPAALPGQMSRRPQKRHTVTSHSFSATKLPTPNANLELPALGTIGSSLVSIRRKGLVSSVVTSTAKFKCDICQLHFTAVDSLLAHHARDHATKKPAAAGYVSCRTCSRKFNSHALLQTHMRCHNKNSLHTCEFKGCNKGYQEIRLLRRHQTMAMHRPPQVFRYRHSFTNGSTVTGARDAPTVTNNDEEDYWSSGIQVIHDPDHVMKKVDAGSTGRTPGEPNGAT